MKKNKLLYLFGLILLFSCDEIDDPFPAGQGDVFIIGDTEFIIDKSLELSDTTAVKNFILDNDWDSTIAPENFDTRFVLLEEFTGHKCIFCPRGTKEIVRLDSIYGEQLIPVGIHAGDFALPDANAPKYFTDYRVFDEDGNIPGENLLNSFQVSGYPSGIVSRLGGIASGKDSWASDINIILNDQPAVALLMKNYFNPELNVVRVDLKVEWQQTLTEDYKLQLYVVEDNIIDWQKDVDANPPDIPNYKHRHVLRRFAAGKEGKVLEQSRNGREQSFQYVLQLSEAWNAQNVDIVAFIYRDVNNVGEVIQANEASVQ